MPKTIFAGGAFTRIQDVAVGPPFVGPDIQNLLLVNGVAMAPIDYSGRFSGAVSYTLQGGGVTGLSLSGAGVLSGTPTVNGTYTLRTVRASNGSETTDSNAFTITVVTSLPKGNVRSSAAVHRAARPLVRALVRKLGS